MSGQHLVCGSHRLDRVPSKNSTSPSALWARRVALMAAATLFAIPETASAQVVLELGRGRLSRSPPGATEAAQDQAQAGSGRSARQERRETGWTAGHRRVGRKAASQGLRLERPVRGGPGFDGHEVASDADGCVQHHPEEPPPRLQSVRRIDALHAAHHLVGRCDAYGTVCPATPHRTAASACRTNSPHGCGPGRRWARA